MVEKDRFSNSFTQTSVMTAQVMNCSSIRGSRMVSVFSLNADCAAMGSVAPEETVRTRV